jgi:hypothetical protein
VLHGHRNQTSIGRFDVPHDPHLVWQKHPRQPGTFRPDRLWPARPKANIVPQPGGMHSQRRAPGAGTDD